MPLIHKNFVTLLLNLQMSAERIRDSEGSIGRGGNRYGDNPPKMALISTVDMLAKIRAAFDIGNKYDDSAQDIINRYSRIKLLILDDMGTEKSTEWANERLFEVIDNRYNENLPIIITTNLPPEQLKKIVGDRIFDRIREVCKLYTITESSHRPFA